MYFHASQNLLEAWKIINMSMKTIFGLLIVKAYKKIINNKSHDNKM